MLKRLLPFALLCTAGTVYVGTLAAPTLAGAAVGTLVGIFSGIVSNDLAAVWDKVAKRLQGNQAILKNKDLTKAVGLAIAAIIAQTAKDETKVNFAYRSKTQALAQYTANHWLSFWEKQSKLDELTPLQENQLTQLYSVKPEDLTLLRVFSQSEEEDKEIWQGIIRELIVDSKTWADLLSIAEETSEINRTVENLAAALSCQFPKALQEVFKEDFETGGKAFAGLTIEMLGNIQGAITQTQEAILSRLEEISLNLPTISGEEGSREWELLQELAKVAGENLQETENLGEFVDRIRSSIESEFQQINQQLAKLQQGNEQAFSALGNRIKSDFANVRELLTEIGVQISQLRGITEQIRGEQREGFKALTKGQEELKNLIRPFAKDNLEDAYPSTEYWQGRKEELAAIQRDLADTGIRLIGILGVGGIGKSTLAAKIYQEFEQDRRFWADLRQPQGNFIILAQRILRHLGGLSVQQMEAIPEVDLANRLVAFLQREPYLIVLDNLETVLQADGKWRQGDEFYEQFFCQWLQRGEKSQLLITTREKPDLPAIKASWRELDEGLKPAEGAALLQALRILGTQAELEEFTTVVRGYPLSLMLVAGLLLEAEANNPQIRYLRRYGDIWQIEGLHGGEQGVSVEAVISWSWHRLSTQQQALLQAVSVYRIPFNARMAAWTISLELDESLIEEVIGTVEQTLRQLAKRALLQKEDQKDDEEIRRYRLHPLILDYVQRHTKDLTQFHQKALAFHQAIAPKVIESANDLKAYQEIVYHQCQLGEYTAANEFHSNNDEWLRRQGYSALLLEMNQNLVQSWQPANEEKENYSWALIRLGNAYNSLGEYREAIAFYEQALAIFRDIGDRGGEASCLNNLGSVYNSLGQYQQMIAFQEQALAIKRDIGDRGGEAACLINLGNAYDSLGQYQQAIAFQEQALAITRDIGDRGGEASCLIGLGNAYDSLGQYQQAIAFQEQALAIKRDIGDRGGEASCLIGLGNVYNSLGQYQQAIAFYQQALAIKRDIGDRGGEASCLGNLGIAYKSLGQYQQAIAFYQQALAIFRDIGDRGGEASCLIGLGNAYDSLGQYQQAIAFQEQALAIKRDIGDRGGEATCLQNLAAVYQKCGRIQESFATSYQAQLILQELELPLEARPYPHWLKSLIRFAQRGKLQLVLCFIGGIIAFPFALIGLGLLLLWRWFAGWWRR